MLTENSLGYSLGEGVGEAVGASVGASVGGAAKRTVTHRHDQMQRWRRNWSFIIVNHKCQSQLSIINVIHKYATPVISRVNKQKCAQRSRSSQHVSSLPVGVAVGAAVAVKHAASDLEMFKESSRLKDENSNSREAVGGAVVGR